MFNTLGFHIIIYPFYFICYIKMLLQIEFLFCIILFVCNCTFKLINYI